MAVLRRKESRMRLLAIRACIEGEARADASARLSGDGLASAAEHAPPALGRSGPQTFSGEL